MRRRCFANQRDRRSLTDQDLLRRIEALDSRKRSGERTDLASRDARSEKSASQTAKIVGTSRSKVEQARVIHCDGNVRDRSKTQSQL